jgi:pyridinium-3,5-bisthiocarboxylic acid mononucleotide nickel chelatase
MSPHRPDSETSPQPAEAAPRSAPVRTAYFDCFAGISGDMTLGALIAAGVDEGELRRGLESLGLPGWELRTRRVQKHAITATDVTVIDHASEDAAHSHESGGHDHSQGGTEHNTHTHAHAHSHGDASGQAHEHQHEQQHTHEHGQPREGASHGQSQRQAASHSRTVAYAYSRGQGQQRVHVHSETYSHLSSKAHSHEQEQEHEHGDGHTHGHGRRLSEILAMIQGSGLPEPVKERASAVFQRLGEAEAKIHDVPVEAIHFHEVGAVDSIIDIVGSVLGLHMLGVERIVCSPLPAGHGFVRAAHGLMPIPAPATMELLKGIPVRPVDVEGELVTPTGAALMATLADEFGWMPPMRVEAIGYGAGKKEFPFPNLLRVCIGVGE